VARAGCEPVKPSHQFSELLERLSQARTVDDLHASCSTLCDLLGFDRFLYAARLPTSFVKPSIKDTAANHRTLDCLTRLGIAIADFGTGYSSLSYRKRYPVDTLKIDRLFVRGIPGCRDDVAIAEAILALASSLGLKVIAEGVETEEQMRLLCERRCHEVQG
jgi:predicted signal transduction protein with EAL and GGDEF domain